MLMELGESAALHAALGGYVPAQQMFMPGGDYFSQQVFGGGATTSPPTPEPSPQVMEAGILPAVFVSGIVGGLASLFANLFDGDNGGGNGQVVPGTNIVLQGPGLKEPKAVKEWSIRMDSKQGDFKLQFYRLADGRVACYNQRTGVWKAWRPYKMAVIGKKLPAHKTLARLRRLLNKHADDAVTILKLTKPYKLESHRRAGGRFIRTSRKKWVD
jgi:hypothetical protein